MRRSIFFLATLILVIHDNIIVGAAGIEGLKVGYYGHTCPEAEAIVSSIVAKAVATDPRVAAPLVRMHFHDCFVRGCDGSILIDSTPGNTAEKDSSFNNPSLSGYEIIDEAKSMVEAKCPEVVSCADILAFAARDGAYQAGGLRWEVLAGRRDGRISQASDIPGNLPSSSLDVNKLTELFAKKHLSQEDMVTLSGAHSIGASASSAFSGDRLYNFSGTGGQDPGMDPHYAMDLKAKCPRSSGLSSNVSVPFDSITPYLLDENYYVGLQVKRGLLKSDQTLTSNAATARMVKTYSNHPSVWRKKFGKAMTKMGVIDVLTGSRGEIRKFCRLIN